VAHGRTCGKMSSQPKRLFPCNHEGCLSVFKKHSHLLRHELIHSDKRPHECVEPGCTASFRSAYHLKRHESTHSGEKKFKCHIDDCQVACLTEWNLKRHIKRTHDGPFKCKTCNQEFKKNKLLQHHVSMEHKSSTVCCDFPGCNAIFSLPSKLKHHTKMHNKGYICSVKGCSQKFQLWSECRQHAALCKSKEMKCDICDKVFTESHNLRAHAKIHDEAREVYQCTYKGCGRFYTKQYNLKVHVQSFHQNIRPFVCPKRSCSKSFHFQHLLRNHLEMHAKKDTDPQEEEVPIKRRRTRRLVASTISNITGYIPELWRRMTPGEIKSYVNDGGGSSFDLSDTEMKDDRFTQKTCTPMSSSELQSSSSEGERRREVTHMKNSDEGFSKDYSTEGTLTAVTTEVELSDDENTVIYERLKSIDEANEHLESMTTTKSISDTSSSATPPSIVHDRYGKIKLSELNQRLKKLAAERKQDESSSSTTVAESCHLQSLTESESDSEIVQLQMQQCVS